MRVAVVTAAPRDRLTAEAADRLDWFAGTLADRGYDVTYLGPGWWADRQIVTKRDGIEFEALTADTDAPPRRLAARLPGALRRVGPAVIHAGHGNPLAVGAAATAATVLGIPLVVDWYDLRADEGWREQIRRLAVRAPDHVIAPSRLVQTGLRELGRSASGLEVIPTALEFDAIRATEPEPLADVVYSGRLDGSANLESLLLALAELRELGWNAAVVGDGPARSGYEAQAADLRIADRIQFLGEQPLERRLALFRGAHVYVHTALQASFAPDMLRALACGCVGIAEYHAGSAAHELIEHRDRGIRVTNEEELVDAIHEATDYDRLSIDESLDGFDVSPIADRYLQVYRRLGVDV